MVTGDCQRHGPHRLEELVPDLGDALTPGARSPDARAAERLRDAVAVEDHPRVGGGGCIGSERALKINPGAVVACHRRGGRKSGAMFLALGVHLKGWAAR